MKIDRRYQLTVKQLYISMSVSIVLALILYSLLSFKATVEAEKKQLTFLNETSQALTEHSIVSADISLKLLGEALLAKGALKHPEQGRLLLDSVSDTDNTMLGYALIKENGEIALISNVKTDIKLPNIRTNLTTAKDFLKALASNHMELGRPYYFTGFKTWVLPLRVKVESVVDGVLETAIMSAGMKLKNNKIVGPQIKFQPWQTLMVIHKSGYPLLILPSKKTDKEMYGSKVPSELLLNLKSHKAESGIFYFKYQGIWQIAHYIKEKHYGLTSVVLEPLSRLMINFIERIYLVFILVFVVTLMVIYLLRQMRTSRLRYENSLYKHVNHDSLTNLYNRFYFKNNVNEIILADTLREKRFFILFLDLDYFKKINDNFGHEVGDQVLQELGKRLLKLVKNGEVVARQGGDEFIMLKEFYGTEKNLINFIKTVIKEVCRPIILGNKSLSVCTSIGVSRYPRNGHTAASLLGCSDIALYRAKENGRSQFVFYSDDIKAKMTRHLEIENALEWALQHNEISVVLQPQQWVKTGEIVGVEALVRWNSATLGFVGPDEFIPIAEAAGKVSNIDHFVMKRAVSMVSRVSKKIGRELHLSVNISAKILLEKEFPQQIKALLELTGFEAGQLNVELTETAVLTGFDVAKNQLDKIRNLGVGISMDDFGTGYSSLTYLHSLPATELKIDRSFISDMLIDATDASLTRSIIDMGHGLNLEVVAEGVEVQEQYDLVKEYNCDLVQGYFIARPLSEVDLLAFLQSREII